MALDQAVRDLGEVVKGDSDGAVSNRVKRDQARP
jgi:hypothetical protein